MRYTLEEFIDTVNNLGYELLNEELNNNSQTLVLKDNKGYLYSSNRKNLLKNAKTKSPLKRFGTSNIYTINNIQLWCSLNDKPFKLISTEYIGNNQHLQWQCLKEDCEEIFPASWNNILTGFGCGYCAGQRVGLSKCLAIKNPELSNEWHPTKNGNLSPYDVLPKSNKEVWWMCDKGHEWSSSISNRTTGRGCRICSGRVPSEEHNLLRDNPELCTEWNYEKNNKRPDDYCPHSGDTVWWICKANPKHIWETKIIYRNCNGDGCPYCAGRLASEDNNLLLNNPVLCEEWNYSKNKKQPEEYVPKSEQKVWWICKDCGNEWEATIGNRNKPNGTNCPECNKSKGEIRIGEWLKQNNILCIPYQEFDGLLGLGNGKLSYDFYLSQYNLLIEYQGGQHEKYVQGFHQTEKDFEKQQEHDRRKKNYAISNRYNFLEIWYWDYDNIETILTNYLKQLSENDSCFSINGGE